MVEGRYGHGILAHQDLEPNSSYFGSYKKDKWSLHFGSTLPEVLWLNSHNFRIRSPNQENLYPQASTEKVTRESPHFVGNACSRFIKFSLQDYRFALRSFST